MKKLLLGIVTFCFIAILSVSSLNATDTSQIALKDLVGDEGFAQYLIDNRDSFGNEYDDIYDTSTQQEFEEFASSVTSIYLNPENDVEDLSSLEYFTDLMLLQLNYFNFSGEDNNTYESIPFSDLTSLQYLYLEENQIEDISSLEDLTNLQRLNLNNNQIKDISSLEKLTSLQDLSLYDNKIEDISSLENLENLRQVLLHENQIIDLSIYDDISYITNLFINDQAITAYLPEFNEYDEVFKSVNCPNEDTCKFILNDFKVNDDPYTETISEDDLTVGTDGYGFYNLKNDDLAYFGYNAEITIVPSTLTADDTGVGLSDAAKNEENLITQLNVKAENDQGTNLTDEVRVVDYGEYDFNNPKLGEYSITLRLGQVASELDKTVIYTVLMEPTLDISNETLYRSEIGTEDDLLKQLDIELTDEYNNPYSSEDIEEIIDSLKIVNFDDLEVGVNTVEVIYTGEYDKGAETTFELTVLIDPIIEMVDNEVTLSNAPKIEGEVLDLLELKVNGSYELPTEGIEINYGGYNFDNPSSGEYAVKVTYTDELETKVTTTSYLTVVDDTEPAVEVEEDSEVKETGYDYNIISMLGLLLMVIVLGFRKIKS